MIKRMQSAANSPVGPGFPGGPGGPCNPSLPSRPEIQAAQQGCVNCQVSIYSPF